MKKLFSRLLTALLCAALLSLLPLQAFAADGGDFVHAQVESMTWITIEGRPAYCYNADAAYPIGGSTGDTYHAAQPFEGQEGHDADEIRSLLYAGYPFDGFGYRALYGVDDELAHYFTQTALWGLLGQIPNFDAADYGEYCEAVYQAAVQKLQPVEGTLALASGAQKLLFEETDDGVYRTGAVSLAGYDGEFTLSLPDGMRAFDAQTDEQKTVFTTRDRFYLQCGKQAFEALSAEASIGVSYTYRAPDQILYYAAANEQNPYRLQNLLSFTERTHTVAAALAFEGKSLPAESVPSQTPESEPEEEIPNETPPLAGPESAVSSPAPDGEEEVIPDGDVPLAPPATGGWDAGALLGVVAALCAGILLVTRKLRSMGAEQ